MAIEPTTAATYRRELSDGLIMRWATPNDAEHIAQLSGMVFRDSEDEPINRNMVRWVLYLMSGEYPLAPVDYGVVEDPNKEGNPIVASMCLLRQEWEYEGIPFRMGRPEIVASDPAYRNRGLIRALMEMLHARSTAEGDLLQGITGILYFYRQFGYEYALDLGGSRKTYLSLIPQAKAGEPEPYTLRPATTD
ncbi:MAG TPA: GNAT family N-acetyltransferase, partial [Ktedonobacteraceae bacterium]|nr:GNAT family N-acetyltransferase [Ktedonobacteraceae bacterium]